MMDLPGEELEGQHIAGMGGKLRTSTVNALPQSSVPLQIEMLLAFSAHLLPGWCGARCFQNMVMKVQEMELGFVLPGRGPLILPRPYSPNEHLSSHLES